MLSRYAEHTAAFMYYYPLNSKLIQSVTLATWNCCLLKLCNKYQILNFQPRRGVGESFIINKPVFHLLSRLVQLSDWVYILCFVYSYALLSFTTNL
jgi:hypothetical protein